MPRKPVEPIKQAQGYRLNCVISLVCGNCVYRLPMSGYGIRHRCSIGKFAVELTASCLQHRKEK